MNNDTNTSDNNADQSGCSTSHQTQHESLEFFSDIEDIGEIAIARIRDTYLLLGQFYDLADWYETLLERAEPLRPRLAAYAMAGSVEEMTGLDTYRKALEAILLAASDAIGKGPTESMRVNVVDWAVRVGVIEGETNEMFKEGMDSGHIAAALEAIGPVVGYSKKAIAAGLIPA